MSHGSSSFFWGGGPDPGSLQTWISQSLLSMLCARGTRSSPWWLSFLHQDFPLPSLGQLAMCSSRAWLIHIVKTDLSFSVSVITTVWGHRDSSLPSLQCRCDLPMQSTAFHFSLLGSFSASIFSHVYAVRLIILLEDQVLLDRLYFILELWSILFLVGKGGRISCSWGSLWTRLLQRMTLNLWSPAFTFQVLWLLPRARGKKDFFLRGEGTRPAYIDNWSQALCFQFFLD